MTDSTINRTNFLGSETAFSSNFKPCEQFKIVALVLNATAGVPKSFLVIAPAHVLVITAGEVVGKVVVVDVRRVLRTGPVVAGIPKVVELRAIGKGIFSWSCFLLFIK